MEVIGPQEIENIQQTMHLNFSDLEIDCGGNQWDGLVKVWEDGRKSTFIELMTSILSDYESGKENRQDSFARLKNLSLRIGSDIVCLYKVTEPVGGAQAPWDIYRYGYDSDGRVWAVIVYAANTFALALGNDLKKTAQAARVKWVHELRNRALKDGMKSSDSKNTLQLLSEGSHAVVQDFFDSVNKDRLLRFLKQDDRNENLVPIFPTLVPEGATTLLEGSVDDPTLSTKLKETGWMVVRRLNKSKRRNRNVAYKLTEQTTRDMIASVEMQCLLTSGLCASKIFIGGKQEWEQDSSCMLARVNDGVGRLGILGFSSRGEYYQLAWVGDKGIEAALIGPCFFPEELKLVMGRQDVYIVGMSVWDALEKLTGRKTGWKAMDPSVITRDLPNASSEKTSFAALVFAATGVDIGYLKEAKAGIFRMIKFRWNKARLTKRQTVWGVLDVTLMFPIIFHLILHWMHRYSSSDFYKGSKACWGSLLEKILGPVVDRTRKLTEMPEDPSNCRDVLLQSAAFAQSVSVVERH